MIKVGVIFGGESVEHEVSIISAVQAMRNLDREKYSESQYPQFYRFTKTSSGVID